MSRLFSLQLNGEMLKLFARRRTYIGFGAFVLIEALVLGLLHLPKPQRGLRRLIEENGYLFADYYSGLTLAALILIFTGPLLGALYLALVAGDVVAKEVEDGTMRMMLCRPVARARLLILKYCAVAIYTFVLAAFLGSSALIAGFLSEGPGGLFVLAPGEGVFALFQPIPGAVRYAAALPLLGLSLLTITSLGFMFSCLHMKPAAATIVTLSLFFIDVILRGIPQFESISEYFMTTRMAAWVHIFDPRIPWLRMVESYAWLLGLDATFVCIGLVAFQRRDLK